MAGTPSTIDIEASVSYTGPRPSAAYSVLSNGSIGMVPLLDTLPNITLQAILGGRTAAPVALEDFREFLLKEDQGAEVREGLHSFTRMC
jgi:hypothetical protein